jgi:hypothetical protein
MSLFHRRTLDPHHYAELYRQLQHLRTRYQDSRFNRYIVKENCRLKPDEGVGRWLDRTPEKAEDVMKCDTIYSYTISHVRRLHNSAVTESSGTGKKEHKDSRG